MTSKAIPWIIKYRPKNTSELINQEEAKRLFIEWIEKWKSRVPDKKCCLLYGPAGCGKTSLVEAVAREYSMELIEMNASDFRDKASIERIAKIAASQASLFTPRGKIILLDEIDGLSNIADKGALEAVIDLINITRNPIVLTANNPWTQQLRPLRGYCLMIQFKRLTKTQILSALKKICEREGLKYEVKGLNLIAQRAEGDLRAAINDLQTIAQGFKEVKLEVAEALVAYRDKEYTPFEALRKMFWARSPWQAKAAFSSTDLDHEMMIEWINENLPNQYEDPEDLWKAYEALSRGSVYLGRIVKTGSWDLLSYAIESSSVGVALARRKDKKFKFVKYTFPKRITELSKSKKMRELREDLASIIGSRILTSKAKAKTDVIPYLHVIFKSNPEYAAKIALAYELTEDQVKFLAGEKSGEVLKELGKLKRLKSRVARRVEKRGSERERQTSLPF